MLSLVQMLFFLGSHFQVADDIFSLSQDTVHGFPFMVVGIRMTLLVMHVVREVSWVFLFMRGLNFWATIADWPWVCGAGALKLSDE